MMVGFAVVTGWVIRSEEPDYWSFYLTGLLGYLTSLAELVSRYRDAPVVASVSLPGIAYLLVNIGAALAALHIVQRFGWDLGAGPDHEQFAQIFLAGFGATAVFRSSLLNITAGDHTVSVGPYAVLHVILTAADRAVDRERALARMRHVRRAMHGISFQHNADTMFTYTVATLQNPPPDEVARVSSKISSLRDAQNADIPDTAKSHILGFSLMALVGSKVLTQAAHHVRELRSVNSDPPGEATGGPEHRTIVLPDESAPTDDPATVVNNELRQTIEVVLAQQEPMLLRDLHRLTRAPLPDFTTLVSALVENETLTIEGAPGGERVSRTFRPPSASDIHPEPRSV
ncbi:hypothetical protein [Kineosporia babensis]|uniref:DUF2637 domain-containing protein n=1 Tax=Kineosporia babensis TaxID=499548 RepID=A0A9X1T4S8_9ACTN|nr:hypothetical protein [Kineosporia babensis]MCD5316948.1 hypothetical protein [Kineosporia babensis]